MVSDIKGTCIDTNDILVLFQADSTDDHICVGVRRRRCDTIMQQQMIMAERTQKAKNTLRTKYGVSEEDNPFLKLPLDLHGYIT